MEASFSSDGEGQLRSAGAAADALVPRSAEYVRRKSIHIRHRRVRAQKVQLAAIVVDLVGQLLAVLLWAVGIVSLRMLGKWIGASTALLMGLLGLPRGIWYGKAPPAWQRASWCTYIVFLTAIACLYPWLRYGVSGYDTCRDEYATYGPATEVEDFARVHTYWLLGSVGLLMTSVLTVLSMAAWHPDSRYARVAVRCVAAIWAQNIAWHIAASMLFCESPGSAGDIIGSSTQAFAIVGDPVLSIWTQYMALARVKALEKTLGESLGSREILALLLATAGLIMPLAWWVALTEIWNLATAILYLIAATFVIVSRYAFSKAFSTPLALLEEEAERVHGAPRTEALWAARRLRRERVVVLLSATTMLLNMSVYIVRSFTGGYSSSFSFKIIGHAASAVNSLVDSASVSFLCGVIWQDRPESEDSKPPAYVARTSFLTQRDAARESPIWKLKVQELAHRGVRLRDILLFFEQILYGDLMPSYDPDISTTNDVVREAIIPLSRDLSTGGGRALASVWNRGQPRVAERMCTHCWSNHFLHLVAALVADGLDHERYDWEARRLVERGGIADLMERLRARGALDVTYWVCAFSVNQHASICGGFGTPPDGTADRLEWNAKRINTVTRRPFDACLCFEPKFFSNQPVLCEMNKFDDMMAYLFEHVKGFSHVVAVDYDFQLFLRAWCVAELVEANTCGIPQSIRIHSERALNMNYNQLSMLDIRECRASHVDDKNMILAKIGDIEAFNERLQWLIFNTEGMFMAWRDGKRNIEAAGRIAARAIQRAQSSQGFSHMYIEDISDVWSAIEEESEEPSEWDEDDEQASSDSDADAWSRRWEDSVCNPRGFWICRTCYDGHGGQSFPADV